MSNTSLLAGAAFAGALALGACTDQAGQPNTAAGTLVGAAAGGLLGSQFGTGTGQVAATALGTAGGALAGSSVGRSLDRANQVEAENRPVLRWQNPDLAGGIGTVQPIPATGAACREYQQNITIAGRTEKGFGTACRQPDGSWRIVR